MNRKLAQFLRLLLGVLLLVLVFKQVDLTRLGDAMVTALGNGGWLWAGLGSTFLGLLCGVVRWKQILAVQGVRLPATQVFRIFFIGQFFNAFMPGACGGDVARAYYVVKEEAKGRRTEAASTVFIDRAIGLFATIVFCCAVICLRLPFIFRQVETEAPAMLMLIFLTCSLVGIFVLFRRNLFEHWAFFRKLEYSSPVGPLIRRAYEAFYLYRGHVGVMVSAFLLSVLNLVFLTAACVCFGRGLEIPLPAIDYFTLFPIITTLAAIPLTPGALGMREGLFVGMFGAVGVGAEWALSLSLIGYAAGAVCSLLGGVFFVNYTSGEAISLRKELETLRKEDPSLPGETG